MGNKELKYGSYLKLRPEQMRNTPSLKSGFVLFDFSGLIDTVHKLVSPETWPVMLGSVFFQVGIFKQHKESFFCSYVNMQFIFFLLFIKHVLTFIFQKYLVTSSQSSHGSGPFRFVWYFFYS
jgi:hypothetical protein